MILIVHGCHVHTFTRVCNRINVYVAPWIEQFERFTGHEIQDLASPLKTQALIEGGIELTLLGDSRYCFRSSDLEALLDKHPSLMTRWLNKGLSLEREDPIFIRQINRLDQQISAAARNNE